ncbi:MAG: sigma-70 family RNA polymerase sigma factor [Bacteroidota bacterium]
MFLAVVIKFLDQRQTARKLSALSDQALVAHYREHNDSRAIAALMDRYQSLIVGLIVRYVKDEEETKDVANELFLKLTEKLKTLDEIRNVKAWLCKVIWNTLHDMNRRAKIRRDYIEKQDHTEQVVSQGGKIDFQLDNNYLQDAITFLNDKEKRCIHHLYFEQKSYQEVMQETGWTFNQVRGLKDRSLKKLKNQLGTEFSGYFNR